MGKLAISYDEYNRTAVGGLNLSASDINLLKSYIYDNFNYENVTRQMECETCNWVIEDIALKYSQTYHGYIAITVCLFGIVANMLTIAVLTRKDLASAPINRILTGIAVADIFLMVEYTSFAYYYYIELPGKLNFPYWGAAFIIFHANFTQILHTISICLTLTLAIWRYIAIGYPEKTHQYCTERRCSLAISISYLLPVLLCAPTYMILEIKSTTIMEDQEYTLYHTSLSDMASKNETYLLLNFWIYAVIIKLFPCCLLTVISIWLIRTLFKVKKRKQVLKGYNACPTAFGAIPESKSKNKGERRADRTTKMLVAVLCLFLVTEFPQGLLALYMGIRGKCVFLKCYQNFGEVLDILALLNGSINFILYCCMNRMFRTTFGHLFRYNILYKWSPPSQSDLHTTTGVVNCPNPSEQKTTTSL
ncbi:probable G-protein coupled receptor 139 isoform X2 [Photinus pyralis]|uniref:probable G-protein coupled receptor 139 isoform X2 n=1 Tax=Photinus pyralis TaxID=7054 RepID=UPI001267368A|nr:probable G-protein coupled receptor 139 isoform X2 [Photinus pyralis]